MEQSITEIERKILDFMVHYLRSNTYQPSIREIGERFGIKSTKTVSEHLQALADHGADFRLHLIRFLGGVDDDAAFRIAPCDIEKTGPKPLMKAFVHVLVAVFPGAFGPFPVRRPDQAFGDRNIEDDGEVGLKIAKHQPMEFVDNGLA